MKTISLILGIFISITSNSLINISTAQEIDRIAYKQECENAYILALDKKEFQAAIDKLDQIHAKTALVAEEYFLMAYCYKNLGDNQKCAEFMKQGWGTPFMDWDYIWKIDALKPDLLIHGFNVSQNSEIEIGFSRFNKLKTPLSDSMMFVVKRMSKKSEAAQNYYKLISENDPSNEKNIKIARDSVNKVNQSLQLQLKKIIKDYGYPGDKLCPGGSEIGYVLVNCLTPEFYDEMKPILLTEV